MCKTNALAIELETRKPLSARIERMLRELDDLELEGLPEEQWRKLADAIRLAHLLHGDFELIIDQCLGGDQELKWRVIQADVDERRGLAVLKHHLSKKRIEPTGDAASALRSLEADQEYYQSLISDQKNITSLPSGSWRVRVRGQSRTFNTLLEAVKFRDDVTAYFSALSRSQNSQMITT